MKVDSQLAKTIESGEFIITAEHAPRTTATAATTEAALKALGDKLTAVNMGDNQHGVAMSSLAASVAALKVGLEPVLQMVTRDRNRIALQSDLLGAASLGIKNVLCLSGYHQTLIGCPEATNVFDIDSTQFIELVTRMTENGLLADGSEIDGCVFAYGGVGASARLHAHDALDRQGAGSGEDQRVFLGVDVVGDGAHVVAIAQRNAQRLHQRGLARANGTADAHAQRRDFGRLPARHHDLNKRLYCISWRLDAIARPGAKFESSSSARVGAHATSAEISLPRSSNSAWPAD
jgi:hypothetical protein